jgi:hypothetical protein
MKEDKHIQWTEKPPSAVTPALKQRTVHSIEDTERFWEEANTALHREFQKGSVIGKSNSLVDTDYAKVVDVITRCIFQSIRDNVATEDIELEARQARLQEVAAAEAVFKSAIQVLDVLKIKLDSNSVICILQGCINEGALQVSKKYERRLRT